MRRRDVFLCAAAAVTAWRAAAQEPPKSAHIGFIVTGGKGFPRHWFDEAMRRLGWMEGHNLAVERRATSTSSNSWPARLRKLMRQSDALLTGSDRSSGLAEAA